MDLVPVTSRRDRAAFHRFPEIVHRGDPNARSTEDDVVRLVVDGPTAFHEHASVQPFLVREGRQVVGRFSIIQDRLTPEWVQIAHFEALPGVSGLAEQILLKARVLHSRCVHVVVGLHGHLNYGAGFLVSPHDLPPVFGLPYTPRYYLDYWQGLRSRDMVSYRFENQQFYDFARRTAGVLDLGDVRIRTMDRRHLARETDIYTWLNNESFQRHPYWADRTTTEDYELFHPFRFLLKEENLLFAEEKGQPVGFLLWYPDFNELVGPGKALGPVEALRYHAANPITTVRLTEIGVHPKCRNRGVVPGLILQMIRFVEAGGYTHCEGGFIFEDNRNSLAMTLRYLKKAFGHGFDPARRYRVFEGEL